MRPTSSIAALVSLLILAAPAVACGRDAATPTPTTPPTTGPAPTASAPALPTTTAPAVTGWPTTVVGWTSEATTKDRNVPVPPVPPVPVLVGIRSAAHSAEGYDRITFDFTGALPGYRVRYVDRVVQDGSGLPVTNAPGRRFLQVVFTPAQAHNDAGAPTVTPRSRTLNYPMMRGYVINGDYEAVLTITIGLDDVVGYRIGELPGRIYVDVAA